MLAVAAAASPLTSHHMTTKIAQHIQAKLSPPQATSGANQNCYKSTNRRWWKCIRNRLPNYSVFGVQTSILTIRGGESNEDDDLDFIDLDEDMPAEDLLDAIFDTQDDDESKSSKGQKSQKQRDKEEKLQASVKKKAASIDDNLFDLDSLLESTSDKPMPRKQSMTSDVSHQKRTRIGRGSSPKLEREKNTDATVSSSTSLPKKTPGSGVAFRNELDRLSKKSLPLSQHNIRQSRINNEKEYPNNRREVPHQNKSYSLGEELLADSHVSRKKRDEKEKGITSQSNSPRSRQTSHEVSSTQQFRAAPIVSTSGAASKIPSPALARRQNITTNSPTTSKNHAVWGPQVQHRKTKSGPPPTKATEDERRAHETQSRIRDERKRLLSNLAIRMNDSHTSAIRALIRGSAAHIPPELFGQTIMQEKSACNEKFYGSVTEMQSSLGGSEAVDSGLDSTVLGEEIDTTAPSFRHIEDPTLLSYWGLTPYAKLYGVSLLTSS